VLKGACAAPLSPEVDAILQVSPAWRDVPLIALPQLFPVMPSPASQVGVVEATTTIAALAGDPSTRRLARQAVSARKDQGQQPMAAAQNAGTRHRHQSPPVMSTADPPSSAASGLE